MKYKVYITKQRYIKYPRNIKPTFIIEAKSFKEMQCKVNSIAGMRLDCLVVPFEKRYSEYKSYMFETVIGNQN